MSYIEDENIELEYQVEKLKEDQKIKKKIDKISNGLVENHYLNFGTYKIAYKTKTGRVIYQDIRDMVA